MGIIYLYDLFSAWLFGMETVIKLNTIQGITIFGSIVAVYAFWVKTLSRLIFSSYHLMRDSEEREQLTYLYLALVDDNKIEESSREIILQSLFSRSDTGLLSKESSPIMPTAADILKAIPKPK